MLCDFYKWPDYLSSLNSVELSEPDNPGRGSTLNLHWHNRSDTASLTHWHPEHQLAWVSGEKSRRIAVRFSLETAEEDQQIRLMMDVEIERNGPIATLNSFLADRAAADLKQKFEPLFRAIKTATTP